METIFNVICFSKDRPFQLREFLRSIHTHLQCDHEKIELVVNVLYTFSSNEDGSNVNFEESYDYVAALFPSVNFVKEDGANNFSSTLKRMVNWCQPNIKSGRSVATCRKNYIVFAVDDVIMYRNISLSRVAAIFEEGRCSSMSSSLFALHLKLNPNITYCHPKGAIARRPSFLATSEEQVGSGVNISYFDRSEGSLDWDYPFDLCCSVYRQSHVIAILEQIKHHYGEQGYSHPNLLELNGNKVLRNDKCSVSQGDTAANSKNKMHRMKLLSVFSKCACPSLPVLSVLTINRVQDIFQNNVYETDCDAYILEERFSQDRDLQLDLVAYKKHTYDSVHIGGLYFKNSDEAVDNLSPLVSVVMCVLDGEKYLEQAISSILCQTYAHFEFIIVNDGSSDGTCNILEEFSKQDSRIKIIQNKRTLGISRSLNKGIICANGDFIARMDCDDISHPERFWYQIQAFKLNEKCDVIGTGVLKFFENDSRNEDSLMGRKIVSNPTNYLMVHWSMFFFCSVAHPTVMMRRRCFFDEGNVFSSGYPEDSDYSCIEDYAFWFHALQNRSKRIMNLGHILLGLRVHPNRVSSRNSNLQLSQSVSCVSKYMNQLIQSDKCSIRGIQALRSPSKVDNVNALLEAAQVLVSLEVKFMEKSGTMKEKYLLKEDVTSRLGELASVGMVKYSSDAIKIWLMWMDRVKKSRQNDLDADKRREESISSLNPLLKLLRR